MDVYGPDGHIDCTFEFNDRGRGPKIAAHYVVAADGLPLRMDITGNDYLKAPVDEHFAVDGGIAHWKSTSENGRALRRASTSATMDRQPSRLCLWAHCSRRRVLP